MTRRTDWHDRIKQAERDCRNALRAMDLLINVCRNQPSYLQREDFALSDLRIVGRGLHDLYFVRMFAAFESCLRSYRQSTTRRKKKTVTQQLLIESIAKQVGVGQNTLDAVQKIRGFRNYLIHGDEQNITSYTIGEAGKHLNAFVAKLPLSW